MSNFSLEQIEEANRDGYIDVVQDEYNLLVRDKEEKFIPYLRKNNIAFIPYFPLAAGLLTGKYTPGYGDSGKKKKESEFLHQIRGEPEKDRSPEENGKRKGLRSLSACPGLVSGNGLH